MQRETAETPHSTRSTVAAATLLCLFAVVAPGFARAEQGTTQAEAQLFAAMLGDTPLVEDLRVLTQEIGGRATGSPSNLLAVDWAYERFESAGVPARKEAFEMPNLWLENSAAATIRGPGLEYPVSIVSMPFSAATGADGFTASLLDAGHGSEADFQRLGDSAAGALLFVETALLEDIEGLFREYDEAYAIELRVVAAGAAGVVYMSSRAPGNPYRHNSTIRGDQARPMMVMDRDRAKRTLGLLRSGKKLEMNAQLNLNIGPAYTSHNVIGEIRGSAKAEEIVVIGAHLDSWDLGGGALDNGANVSMLIDIARQIRKAGLTPARTIRFALWNGEEQGLYGSYGYTKLHEDELDRHVVAMSFDIGCGLINGFFTGGRPELLRAVDRALEPVRGLGPFTNLDIPIVGTDNYDFMMQGVGNLVGNQESATYGPNYHATTDQFHECDLKSLRLNSAIVAAVVWSFANEAVDWKRQSRADIESLIETTDLEKQMRSFSVWEAWKDGTRGRR